MSSCSSLPIRLRSCSCVSINFHGACLVRLDENFEIPDVGEQKLLVTASSYRFGNCNAQTTPAVRIDVAKSFPVLDSDRLLPGLRFPCEQKIQPPEQVVHCSIEIADSLCVCGYFHSLKVEAQIICKLSGTLDTLCR